MSHIYANAFFGLVFIEIFIFFFGFYLILKQKYLRIYMLLKKFKVNTI